MNAGIYGLIGAAIGGGASLCGTWLAQSTQARRESQAREQETRERAFVAARLVLGDLAWSKARVRQALNNEKYWSSRYELSDDSWAEHRETLAVCLTSPEEWSIVHDGFRAIRALKLQASKRRSDDPQSRPALNAWAKKQAETSLASVIEAMQVLEPVAGAPLREEPVDDS
jgi:hypothetical protein